MSVTQAKCSVNPVRACAITLSSCLHTFRAENATPHVHTHTQRIRKYAGCTAYDVYIQ